MRRVSKNLADLVNKTPFAIFLPNNISFNIIVIITAHLLILLFTNVISLQNFPTSSNP